LLTKPGLLQLWLSRLLPWNLRNARRLAATSAVLVLALPPEDRAGQPVGNGLAAQL
jgi:hypothetical protein